MKFTKMHGCGNDYVYIDGSKLNYPDHGKLAQILSNRHKGIGSDGLILINPSDIADFEMEMYNLDGSRSEMCGNGIRCVGKYVYDKGMTDKTEITVETLAGIKTLTLHPEDGKVKSVTVDMGEPILEPAEIPIDVSDYHLEYPIEVLGKEYHFTAVSMGNPHAVVFLDSVADLNLEEIGPHFEHHPYFPNRVNTEFIRVISPTELEMRVWERGTGETMACGTGTCASVVAAILQGISPKNEDVLVHLLGGDLHIRWDESSNKILMTGPASISFEGDYNMNTVNE